MSYYELFDENRCIIHILACVFLTFSYVGSLYIWRSNLSRDHPSTIKRRFFSVFCMMLLAPYYCNLFYTDETLNKGDFYERLGLRWPGLINAAIWPLLLTATLFLGPLTMQFLSGIWRLYVEPQYWMSVCTDLVWVRNYVMAPLSEEWVFRSCMVPLLLQCLSPVTAAFTGPLLFGTAHFHHMLEQMKSGHDFKTSFLISSFQFTYTSLFGAYSSYLFMRTGHFIAPLLAHMFCNHMGFPNVIEVARFPPRQRKIIIFGFLLGFVLWCILLVPTTDPSIYDNTMFWEN